MSLRRRFSPDPAPSLKPSVPPRRGIARRPARIRAPRFVDPALRTRTPPSSSVYRCDPEDFAAAFALADGHEQLAQHDNLLGSAANIPLAQDNSYFEACRGDRSDSSLLLPLGRVALLLIVFRSSCTAPTDI